MVSRINHLNYLSKINKRLVLFLTLLILISAFLRFYNIGHLAYWMFDEERDAFLVKKIIVDKHPILIGGSIPGGFYLAPGYFYISAFFYFFSKGNPIGPIMAASTIGTLSVLLLFFVCLKLFNKKIAVFSALIYCSSYLVIIYNRTWWPLTFAPIISLVTYYCLFEIAVKKNIKYSLPLSLFLIIGAQSDPSNFSLIILTLLIWFLYKLPVLNKHVIASIFIFIVSHATLVVFDIRHNFFNLRQIIKMFEFQNNSQKNIDLQATIRSLIIFPQTVSRFIFVSLKPDMSLQISPDSHYVETRLNQIPISIMIVSFSSIIGFLITAIKSIGKKNNFGIKILSLHLLIAILGISTYNLLFPGYTNEWFFQVLFPAFSIVFGLLLFQISKSSRLNILVWIILFFYLSIGIYTIYNAKNSYNFADKSEAVKWAIEKTKNKTFYLDSIGKNFSYGGYRYLFYNYGKEPQKSFTDHIFDGWLYQTNNNQAEPQKSVVIVNSDFYQDDSFIKQYNDFLSKAEDKKRFGKIEVLIINNEKNY